MINITWSQFEKNQAAKDISFESFCFQISHILYKDYGYFDSFFNTPGSEFYLTLHTDCPNLNLNAGDEIGWQAKWWVDTEDNTSLTPKRREELIAGFKTTLNRHPNIKLWIICTPGDFVEDVFKKLKDELTSLSKNTTFTHWKKATFTNYLSSEYDKFSNVFNHYFSTNFIGFDFIKEYSQNRINYLKNKFDTELYTPTHYDDEILLSINYKKLSEELEIRIKYLQDEVVEVENNKLFFKSDFQNFTKEYISKAYELLNLCVNTSKETIEIVNSKINIEKANTLHLLLQSHIKEYRQLADFLNKKIQSKEHLIEGKNEHGLDGMYHKDFLIDSINKIQGLLISSKEEDKEEDSFLDIVEKFFLKDLHILSSAGYGKTNIACNICSVCLRNNTPSLLLLGSSFRKNELPQTIILEHLGLNTKYTFKEFLQALNTLGFVKGVKVPIIIDGLNESKPYDDIWRTNIKDIIRDISKLEYVILITTCRDRYIEAIFEVTDINEIPNTKTLVGLDEKQRLKAIPKYFKKYNIKPTSWSFNKDLFVNPLLLKIFSEVNKNAENIHISLDSIFNSIDKYITNIENKGSEINSKIDPILRGRIQKGIERFCEALWKNDTREMTLEDFHSHIDPNHPSLVGSLTEKLLDEGLCFQKNLVSKNETKHETVQFTYDLVGGYTIASKILVNQSISSENLKERLIKLNIEQKLFNKNKQHDLKQDILMSLLHLLPQRNNINLFDIFDREEIIEECFNSVDFFIGNKEAQEKLLIKISLENKESRNYKLLFEKLFENIFKKDVHGLGEFTITVLKHLNQCEIDIFWTELIRKNTNTVTLLLETLNKNYIRDKKDKFSFEQDFFVSYLSTTSSDKSIRDLATENLFLISKNYPNEYIKSIIQIIELDDLNALESVIVALCGSVLSLKQKQYTLDVLEFLAIEFVPNFKSTHACIIDNINTVLEFAFHTFGFEYKSIIIFDTKNFNPKIDKGVHKEYKNSFHFPYLFGVDLYDFGKYAITSIASDGYSNCNTFTEAQCLAIISNRVKEKGFKESLFDFLKNGDTNLYGVKTYDESKSYPKKYIWQAYFELVGFLVLSNKLKSEDGKRYRSDFCHFDPTFPRMPKKFQLISNCLFPTKKEDIQDWVNSDNQNIIDEFYIHNLHSDFDWVLLSANISQRNEEKDIMFSVTAKSYLIASKQINKFKELVARRGYYRGDISFHKLYSGEINWSMFSEVDMSDYYGELSNIIDVMYDYSWSSYTSGRFENPYFKFLNSKVSNILDLEFNTNDLSFYEKNNDVKVTKIVWSEGSSLYYIRKDYLLKLLKIMNLELVWYQHASKYGEFSRKLSRKLDPSYKDLRKVEIFDKTI